MIRKIFIGSSAEGLPLAHSLKEKLEESISDFVICEIWKDGKIFSQNKGTLDSLVVASRKYDYGVLVATADDVRKLRGKKAQIPRDNVMFEMGMFLGSLGLTRAFLLVESTTKLPTDYDGVTVPIFDRNVEGSLDQAIKKIATAIQNTRQSFNLKPIPSAALALSYFDNFVQQLAKRRLKDRIPFNLKILIPPSIHDVRTTIEAYKAKHKSEEVSVFDDGARPRVHRLVGDEEEYWDIPTTLSTLHKLINLVNPSHEIGIEEQKQDWISHELRNFKGTLEVLIAQCEACDGQVTVEFK